MALSVICNADDFGISEGASRGIVDCHLAGAVTSATWMANMPASAFAADLARANPRLGVGLHFNLTSGAPLSEESKRSGLVGVDGQFVSRKKLACRLMTGRVGTSELASELAAQLAEMKRLGLRPTHIDSHQHVHAFPPVFDVVSREAASLGLPVRLPVRWPGRRSRRSLKRRLSEAVLDILVSRCVKQFGRRAVANDGLCSVFDLGIPPKDIAAGAYPALLEPYLDGVVELMVHPAIVDQELKQLTGITEVSAVEYRLLLTGCIQDSVAARGGRLCTYADAWA